MTKNKIEKRLFLPRIRSRHPSHDAIRGKIQRMPFPSVIRFGSTTEVLDAGVQINTVEAIRNSSSKIRMKACFAKGEVRTASYCTANDLTTIKLWSKDKFPIVSKSEHGSRGIGNTLIKTPEDFNRWVVGKNLSNYVFERFHNYNREYRLHVTEDGCFYTCRKVLRDGTPEKDRWFRNDSNSNWLMENNPSFDKPVNWKTIETECVKALKSCGLDFGACDVKVQSANDEKGRVRENPDFIVIEINSAPSFGEVTAEMYRKMLPGLLKKKYSLKRK